MSASEQSDSTVKTLAKIAVTVGIAYATYRLVNELNRKVPTYPPCPHAPAPWQDDRTIQNMLHRRVGKEHVCGYFYHRRESGMTGAEQRVTFTKQADGRYAAMCKNMPGSREFCDTFDVIGVRRDKDGNECVFFSYYHDDASPWNAHCEETKQGIWFKNPVSTYVSL